MGSTTNSNFSPAPNPMVKMIKAKQQFLCTPPEFKDKNTEMFDKIMAVQKECREKIEDINYSANEEILLAEVESHNKQMAIFNRAINGEPEKPIQSQMEIEQATLILQMKNPNNYFFHVP